MPIKVDASCIDMMRHTNNKVYLAWMEQAALEHSAAVGWSTERYMSSGGGFVAKQHWIDYRRPTFLGDELVMYTWVEDMEGPVSLRRFELKKDGKTCLRAATLWAYVSFATGRSASIPHEVSDAYPIVEPGDPELKDKGLSTPELRVPEKARQNG